MVRIIYITLALLLAGCFTTDIPKIDPASLMPPKEAIEVQRVADIKNDTLWMYSTGSFALLCVGLAITAFWASNRLAGAVFIAGGLVGMATIWLFESKWFPWVAGITVAFIILNALALLWVKVYRHFFSSSPNREE